MRHRGPDAQAGAGRALDLLVPCLSAGIAWEALNVATQTRGGLTRLVAASVMVRPWRRSADCRSGSAAAMAAADVLRRGKGSKMAQFSMECP
jgi:hypothetical protein